MNKFSRYLTNFFTIYLKTERNCSNNTILSYRDTFKLFFRFLKNKGINIKKFDITNFTKELVMEFLDDVEKKTSITTRNLRKAAFNSFCNYILIEEPIVVENVISILSIKTKKAQGKIVKYLLEEDMKLLLNEPNIQLKKERNDMIMLSILYDTGTRISEFCNIKLKDISFQKPYFVKVLGKGNKFRNIPIMPNTMNLIEKFVKENNVIYPEQYLFCNSRGEKYSTRGISHKIDKYTKRAQGKSPTFPKHIHPHMFRHTKAVSMLNRGIDIFIIGEFLGHENLKSTKVYAKITDDNKRKILEKAYFEDEIKEIPDWLENKSIMDFLEEL